MEKNDIAASHHPQVVLKPSLFIWRLEFELQRSILYLHSLKPRYRNVLICKERLFLLNGIFIKSSLRLTLKQKRFKKIAWSQSHHLHLHKNSNYGQESLLEVKRQNIAGHCQQTFENKKLVDINVLPHPWPLRILRSNSSEQAKLYTIQKGGEKFVYG